MSDEKENVDKPPVASRAGGQVMPSRRGDRWAQLALMISFCIISMLGGILIYHAWKEVSTWQGVSTFMAFGRCGVFVTFMAAAHLVGYRLWRRQFAQSQDDGDKLASRPISSAYWPPVKTALLQQSIVLILAALTLDGGLTLNVAVIAILAYWLAFGVIVFRRAASPTRGDVLLVRYGFLLIFVCVLIAGPIAWRALGRL